MLVEGQNTKEDAQRPSYLRHLLGKERLQTLRSPREEFFRLVGMSAWQEICIIYLGLVCWSSLVMNLE